MKKHSRNFKILPEKDGTIGRVDNNNLLNFSKSSRNFSKLPRNFREHPWKSREIYKKVSALIQLLNKIKNFGRIFRECSTKVRNLFSKARALPRKERKGTF